MVQPDWSYHDAEIPRGEDQHQDAGAKMVHAAPETTSKIVSKSISKDGGITTYRGLVRVDRNADGARNYTQCDSLLIGKQCGAHTFPYIEVKNPGATVEHEATTSKISDDQLFYCRARGISQEDAVSMIVDGFCKQVFRELPMEFAVWAARRDFATANPGLVKDVHAGFVASRDAALRHVEEVAEQARKETKKFRDMEAVHAEMRAKGIDIAQVNRDAFAARSEGVV